MTRLPVCTTPLDSFSLYSSDEVRNVIISMPDKSCSLDPLPMSVLKEFLPELLPILTEMCNCSLREGFLPLNQRHAIVIPNLKKVGADPSDVCNYRPISNLSFVSKLVERLVSLQLTAFLDQHGLLPRHQSGFRKKQSTETALLKVLADILAAVDRGNITLLGLLDMSAAFDTVDHQILLHRLEVSFGLHGSVLSWLRSFLSSRTQQVIVNGSSSVITPVTSGVPQGSVLGPLLFILYIADISVIASDHNIDVHCYADDAQLYVFQRAVAADVAVFNISACIKDIDIWMHTNRLKLNSDKTQFIWFGTRQQLTLVRPGPIDLGGGSIELQDTVSDLGMTLDS